MLRVGAVMAVPVVLRRLGMDPATVLAEAGFDAALFDDPDHRISYLARGHLMAHCVARSACPHFGLLVGREAGLNSFGLVGLLAQSSPDVGTALRHLVRFFFLHARGAATTLQVDGNVARLGYDIYQPQAEANDQVGGGAVAVAFNVLRELCGPRWKPVEVRFAHRRPDDVGPFRRFFRVPLCFDAEQYAVVFAADWLTHSLPKADPALLSALQQQIDALAARHGDDFPEQVRSMLHPALIAGQGSADQVAAIFSMHSRTLNRRLNAFGTRFRDLVEEARFEIARQLLSDSAMHLIQIAAMLDYADASAFTRAFRRWSGTTPGKWRATRSAQRR